MPLEDPVRQTAESIHKIMLFVLYRVPPEKRAKFLSRIRGKVEEMNPMVMSGKKTPISSTIGHVISMTKHILNGLSPTFTNQVLQELVLILSQYKGEKTAMLKKAEHLTPIDVEIQPFDSAIQKAFRNIDPKMITDIKRMKEEHGDTSKIKVIVHRGLGGGKLGYVQSGIGKDPFSIHLFRDAIMEDTKSKGGGISGREFEDAFTRALVNVIGHEGGHILGAPGTGFSDEHAAEQAGAAAVEKMQADDRPISKRDKNKKNISKRQNALDRNDVGWGDNSGSGMEFFDPAAEELRPTDTQSYEHNVGNMAGGEAQVEAPQGSYGGSGFGLFSIPVGMNCGTVGSLERPISKRAWAITLAGALTFLVTSIGGEIIGVGMRTAHQYLSEIREIFKTLFKSVNIIHKDAENILSWAKKISPKLHPQAKNVELQIYNCWFAIMKLQTLMGQEKATEQDFQKYLNVLKKFQQNKNSLLGQVEAIHSVSNNILIQKKIKSRIVDLTSWRFKKLHNGIIELSKILTETESKLEIMRSKIKHIKEMTQTKKPAKTSVSQPDEPGMIGSLS